MTLKTLMQASTLLLLLCGSAYAGDHDIDKYVTDLRGNDGVHGIPYARVPGNRVMLAPAAEAAPAPASTTIYGWDKVGGGVAGQTGRPKSVRR